MTRRGFWTVIALAVAALLAEVAGDRIGAEIVIAAAIIIWALDSDE